MKIKKVSKALIAAGLGGVILVGSAAADMALGSGYGQLKESLKITSRNTAGLLDSYTVSADVELKLDDRVLSSQSGVLRYDLVNQRNESEERGYDFEGEAYDRYYYHDATYHVNSANNHGDGIQYYAYAHESGWDGYEDVFEEEYAADIEKIADAAVGSLADVISVENADGKKIYSGHVTDAEIPALANALVAFVAKYSFSNDYSYREADFDDALTENVYVESVSGKAMAREDGVLESGVAKISICGQDPQGQSHTLTAGISLSLTDINSTVVEAFDVTREDVELSQVEAAEVYGLKEKHEGTYKCDITKSTKDVVEKTGECVLILDEVTDTAVSGSYAITEGDETIAAQFTGTLLGDAPFRARLSCTDGAGNVTNGILTLDGNDYILRLMTDVEVMDNGFSYNGVMDYTLYRQF